MINGLSNNMTNKRKITVALSTTESGQPSGLLMNWNDDELVVSNDLLTFSIFTSNKTRKSIFMLTLGNRIGVFGDSLIVTDIGTIKVLSNNLQVAVIYIKKTPFED